MPRRDKVLCKYCLHIPTWFQIKDQQNGQNSLRQEQKSCQRILELASL